MDLRNTCDTTKTLRFKLMSKKKENNYVEKFKIVLDDNHKQPYKSLEILCRVVTNSIMRFKL